MCLQYASLHCTWSLSHTYILRSPSLLSPEMSCLFRPQTAPPRQMLSPLILHLPPPSLTILIYSKGCYPNEPEHNAYHSSPYAVTPQLLSLSTGENAASVFPQGWNKTEILGVQVEWQNHWPGTQETCFVLPCKSLNLTEPRESCPYNGHGST